MSQTLAKHLPPKDYAPAIELPEGVILAAPALRRGKRTMGRRRRFTDGIFRAHGCAGLNAASSDLPG